MDRTEALKELDPDIINMVSQRADERSRTSKWDLNIAIFLFAILILVILLSFQKVNIILVAPIAVFGLSMVWFVGWRRSRQLFHQFYKEELEQELKKSIVKSQLEESIEMMVQKSLLKRLR